MKIFITNLLKGSQGQFFPVTSIATGEKIQHTLFVNMILRSAQYWGTSSDLKSPRSLGLGNWFNAKVIVSVASVELSRFVTSELLIPSNEDKQE